MDSFRQLYKTVYNEYPSECTIKTFKEMIKIRYKDKYEISNSSERLKALNDRMDILSDPSCFLKGSKNLFEIDFYAGTLREDYGIDYHDGIHDLSKVFGWRSGGGPNWGKVCQLLLNREEYTKTMFVDQAFDIHHNTGIFLNKIKPTKEQDELVRDIHKIDEDIGVIGVGIKDDTPEPWTTVKKLLDEREEGNLEIMYRIVRKYDSNVEEYAP